MRGLVAMVSPLIACCYLEKMAGGAGEFASQSGAYTRKADLLSLLDFNDVSEPLCCRNEDHDASED